VLWDVVNARVVNTYQGHTGAVCSVAISPDGKQVYCAPKTGPPNAGC
jgi:WD40 repeat protein